MGQAQLILGPERRRRWREDEKTQLVAEAFGPGGSVAEVARRADICTSLLYRWRRAQGADAPTGFVPAIVQEPAPVMSGPRTMEAAITVELPSGARVTIGAAASPMLVAATFKALR
jgi:transposase